MVTVCAHRHKGHAKPSLLLMWGNAWNGWTAVLELDIVSLGLREEVG